MLTLATLLAVLGVSALQSAAAPAVAISPFTSAAPFPKTFDLTEAGTLDWVHWGGWEGDGSSPGFDHKSDGGDKISDYSSLDAGGTGGTAGFHSLVNNAHVTYSWTDGTVQSAQVAAPWGVQCNGTGLTFTVAADTSARQLILYTGSYNAEVQLTASLASGSTATDTYSGASRSGYYVIDFTGASNSDVLTIELRKMSELRPNANLTIQAAALAVPDP